MEAWFPETEQDMTAAFGSIFTPGRQAEAAETSNEPTPSQPGSKGK